MELNILGWNPLASKEDIEELYDLFCNFNQSILVDVKYFSADQVVFEIPGDTSEDSHCYIKFQSFDPAIADNKDKNEIVIKFTGVEHIGITSGVRNKGNVEAVRFSLTDDGFIVLNIFNNNQDLSKDLITQAPPSFIVARSAGWNYDFGDDMK